MPIMFPLALRYSEASRQELSAFLAGTHQRVGRGSLPCRLASRGGLELLRIIAEFILAPRSFLYAGTTEGQLQVFELCEVCGCAPSLVPHPSPSSSQVAGREPQPLPLVFPHRHPLRINALVVNSEWLVAASSCGRVRVFRLPSFAEQVSVDLGVLLPPQQAAITDQVALIASRRTLYVLGLECQKILQELPLAFSGKPSVTVQGSSVYVQCDEAIRVWSRATEKASAALEEEEEDLLFQAEFCELWKPHRQIVIGLAVLPEGNRIVTASPEELRGWSWSHREGAHNIELLWTLQADVVLGGQGIVAITSLMWKYLPQSTAGCLVVLGKEEGHSVLSELDLSICVKSVPKRKERIVLGESASCEPHLAIPKATSELVLWSSEVGWAMWDRTPSGRLTHLEFSQGLCLPITTIAAGLPLGPAGVHERPA